jgi:DNA-binding transcriptional LysR family regulator
MSQPPDAPLTAAPARRAPAQRQPRVAFATRDLATFVAVARRGSFSAAAADLGSDPASIARSLDALERDLALTLVDRAGPEPTLTADGVAFLPHAASVLDAASHAEAYAAVLAAPTG